MKKITETQRATLLSILVASLTLGLKFIAYFLTGSISLFSDAIETLINIATAFMALIVMTIVAEPPDEKHPYGHDKAEYFSSGMEGALILAAAISIIYASIHRFMNPSPLSQLSAGLIISVIAAVLNLITSRFLLKVSRKHDSITLEAHARHLLTDVWTTVGVIIGLFIILFAPPGWQMLDPIMAILVALNILYTGIHLMIRSFDGLMDSALSRHEIHILKETINKELSEGELSEDIYFKDLKTRKSGARRFVEFKLFVGGETSVSKSHALCDALEVAIEKSLKNTVVTIHVEPIEEKSI